MSSNDWGEPPEVTIEQFDTIEFVNGTAGCAECGGLLAVETRRRGTIGSTRQINNAMLPEPVVDVDKVQCASCGTVLWRDQQES